MCYFEDGYWYVLLNGVVEDCFDLVWVEVVNVVEDGVYIFEGGWYCLGVDGFLFEVYGGVMLCCVFEGFDVGEEIG